MDADQERAMRMAIDTIQSLRRRNEILEAKVEVMNLFGLTLQTAPAYPTQGMGEDSAWLLQRCLDNVELRKVEAKIAEVLSPKKKR